MPDATDEERRTLLNPADQRDVVGWVQDATPDQARLAVARAALAAPSWAAVPVVERAERLERAADAMQAEIGTLIGLLVREAGKSVPNAIAEVREAIDFLRYYAGQARTTLEGHRPLGVITCISPWNFPLAIFTGQIAAALVAGSSVLAKPAEETPLIAAEAVRLLHEAGIPAEVLQLVPGAGEVGAALVEASQTAAVMFTGSTEVARLIQKALSKRLSAHGQPIPLIAETGGQNAMIVDSSALAEQVVGDVVASAFDSAGQRCSALRILCLQEDVADHVLKMLKGALKELTLGNTDRLSVDVGPVITQEAKDNIERHISAMSARGLRIEQIGLAPGAEHGTFVAPTIIEIERLSDVEREVFGPVLHVLRFRRDRLDTLIDDINASGFGLTFGLHTRLDETIAHVTSRVQAGNLYINRNVIGAIVGVQPFGGRGLSGTGPKAGGPLYLGRLVETAPALPQHGGLGPASAIVAFADWLVKENMEVLARQARAYAAQSPLGMERELEGPVGERNLYALHPRGRVLLLPSSDRGLCNQLAALLATGNDAVIPATPEWQRKLAGVPAAVAERLSWAADWTAAGPFAGALVEGDAEAVGDVLARLAALPGPIVSVQVTTCEAMPLHWLLEEVSTSINTTAAGGNASLMAIG
jgi:RHH-type proline utilization regulon transcriptional repressor/proline dehydrogenase/delta 1-pyrroline-5-carboxylate dehydrogenase